MLLCAQSREWPPPTFTFKYFDADPDNESKLQDWLGSSSLEQCRLALEIRRGQERWVYLWCDPFFRKSRCHLHIQCHRRRYCMCPCVTKMLRLILEDENIGLVNKESSLGGFMRREQKAFWSLPFASADFLVWEPWPFHLYGHVRVCSGSVSNVL